MLMQLIQRSFLMVSRRRKCPRCDGERVMRYGGRLTRRYSCLQCGTSFHGTTLLGIRVGK